MQTAAFETALDDFLEFATDGRTVMMCAEGVWWRCHRQLVADALVARGVEVRHILAPGSAPLHTLTPFSRVEGGKVTYPAVYDAER